MMRFKAVPMPHNENEQATWVVVDGQGGNSHETASLVCVCYGSWMAREVATALELRPPTDEPF